MFMITNIHKTWPNTGKYILLMLEINIKRNEYDNVMYFLLIQFVYVTFIYFVVELYFYSGASSEFLALCIGWIGNYMKHLIT